MGGIGNGNVLSLSDVARTTDPGYRKASDLIIDNGGVFAEMSFVATRLPGRGFPFPSCSHLLLVLVLDLAFSSTR